jgi:hypothetical protein
VNDLNSTTNDALADERQPNSNERRRTGASAVTTGLNTSRPSRQRRPLRNATVAIILAFWIFYFFGTTAIVFAMNPSETRNLYVPRVVVSVAGVVISFIMVWVQNRLQNSTLSRRAIVALAMAVAAPLLHFYANFVVFSQFFPRWTPGPPSWAEFTQDYFFRLWIFGSLSGIILALSYAADIREREERIHALQALAHSAHIRALRNQLNPHFLFNALNSIVSLVSRSRGGEAELMTENLADFLRTTLALDPEKIIPLSEEVRLQELYLSIEKVRFPDRLQISFDIPDELEGVQIPALITQPLIENSIKYAVARSTQPVQLRIRAESSNGQVLIIIEDDGGDAGAQRTKGARMGLSNVAERLNAHYGDEARLDAHAKAEGGFVNIIAIPLQRTK